MKKTLRFIGSLLVAGILAGSLHAADDADGQLVSKTDSTIINWTGGYVTAVGRGEPPLVALGDEQDRKTALSEAVSDARQKLMTAVMAVPIDARSTVGDFARNDAAVYSTLREMVGTAEVVHQEFSTGGAVDVIVRMSMNGGFSQLVLPKVIRQIESVKPISNATTVQQKGKSDGAQTDSAIVSGPYTGMIVDVRGILITPCMAPRICDENGQEVFGPTYASREYAVQRGMSGYVLDMDAAVQNPRVAGSPLVLKGLRAGGDGGNDIIVSNTDAARLRSDFENLTLLRQCRVMIVMDEPDAGTKG